MIKTLTVNIGGMVYTIDEDAYQLLETYLNNLKKHFAHDESADEILNDMEQRMGELFCERIESKNQIITLKDVEEVIKLMGQPEDFQEEESDSHTQNHSSSAQDKSTGTTEKGQRRLFRDPDDKILGGVLAGVAHYFEWDVTLVRLAVVLISIALLHVSIGTVFIVYLIAWAIIPEASDATDRLAMFGQKINVENIGKTVTDGFERASNFVKDPNTKSAARRFGEGIVNIFGIFAKILLVLLALAFAPAAFALIIACFALVMAGLGILTAIPGIFSAIPFMDSLVNFQFNPVMVWTLAISGILVAVLPLFALIHTLFHHFGNAKPMGVYTRVFLITIWIIALGVAIGCGSHFAYLINQFNII